MFIANLKTVIPVDLRGYVPCEYTGRGNLPVFRFHPFSWRPFINDVIRVEINAEIRINKLCSLPGQVVPRFGSERTVIDIYPYTGDVEGPAKLDLYIVAEYGKSTIKSQKYRYTAPPSHSVQKWTFRALSGGGTHWLDVHIFTVPVGENGNLVEDEN